MMLQFLTENGFGRSLDTLQQETGVSLAKHAPADNMDITTIFNQYEEYYDIKFGRKPKFFRTVEDGGSAGNDLDFGVNSGERMMKRSSSNSKVNTKNGGKPPQPTTPPAEGLSAGGAKLAGLPGQPLASQRNPGNNPMPQPPMSTGLQQGGGGYVGTKGVAAGGVPRSVSAPANAQEGGQPQVSFQAGGKAIPIRKATDRDGQTGLEEEEPLAFEGRLALKPLPHFGTAELNELAQVIFRDILDHDPSVGWSDIAELAAVKSLLKEAVVMPIKYPQLFSGIVRPWHGILLFGPPGTGKTMMAKAVATECRTTFFNVSASTIVSKWRGDSEKLVRMLFDLAVHFAPSTIFIDELDSIMSQRSSDGSEHEGSRRMKTELLIQMDGLSKRKNGDIVFVMAASNVPWDLDGAMLRRLEKRICVGLPTFQARKHMFRKNLVSVTPDFDFDRVAQMTEGHSGADVDVICREATMRTIRILIQQLESANTRNGTKLSEEALDRPQVKTDDVVASIQVTKTSSGHLDPRKYQEWEKKHGSTTSGVSGVDASAEPLDRNALLDEAFK